MRAMIRQTTFQTVVPANGQIFFVWFAANARLRCSIWINFNQFSTSFFRFVIQLFKKAIPSDIVNLFGKNAFTQTFDVQIFNRNQVILSNNQSGNFVLKIVSLITYFGVNLLQYRNSFLTPFTSFFATRNFSLNFAKLFLTTFKIFKVVYLRSVRKRDERFYSSIKSDLFSGLRKRFVFGFNRKGNIPFTTFPLNGRQYFARRSGRDSDREVRFTLGFDFDRRQNDSAGCRLPAVSSTIKFFERSILSPTG
jgi:hypothetical protein